MLIAGISVGVTKVKLTKVKMTMIEVTEILVMVIYAKYAISRKENVSS